MRKQRIMEDHMATIKQKKKKHKSKSPFSKAYMISGNQNYSSTPPPMSR